MENTQWQNVEGVYGEFFSPDSPLIYIPVSSYIVHPPSAVKMDPVLYADAPETKNKTI
jgi:hypothetical protein